MKKKIIIDSVDEVKVKKIERNIKNKPYHRLINNKYLEWLIYMIGYSIVLITVSAMFKSFEINMAHFGIYALLASIIIYILNQTIKPIINYLTTYVSYIKCYHIISYKLHFRKRKFFYWWIYCSIFYSYYYFILKCIDGRTSNKTAYKEEK